MSIKDMLNQDMKAALKAGEKKGFQLYAWQNQLFCMLKKKSSVN